MGVQNDGTLWGWGLNDEGQLGDGGTDSLYPVQIGTLKTWKAVAAGASHTAAMQADSTLWTWGRNTEGQLGNASNTTSSTPVNIAY
jgi:alpha-tubulin suppressor-like RCC1 family protein